MGLATCLKSWEATTSGSYLETMGMYGVVQRDDSGWMDTLIKAINDVTRQNDDFSFDDFSATSEMYMYFREKGESERYPDHQCHDTLVMSV